MGFLTFANIRRRIIIGLGTAIFGAFVLVMIVSLFKNYFSGGVSNDANIVFTVILGAFFVVGFAQPNIGKRLFRVLFYGNYPINILVPSSIPKLEELDKEVKDVKIGIVSKIFLYVLSIVITIFSLGIIFVLFFSK